MKSICIIGAGAIGGLIGTRLGQNPEIEMHALARGQTLQALKKHGLRLAVEGKILCAGVTASDNPAELGIQDCVIISLKGQHLPNLATSLAPLIGPETVILSAMNGIPWWFAKAVPALQEMQLDSVDPGGRIEASLPFDQVIGSVLHISASTKEPGLASHTQGNKMILGTANGKPSAKMDRLAGLLTKAGFEVSQTDHIRQMIWYKLWGNLTMNPVSALTGSTADQIIDDDLARGFCSAIMIEAARLGRDIGCEIDEDPEDRHAVTRKLGAFKTSMLQDAEAGRELELDTIVTAVVDISRHLGHDTPHMDSLLGLVRLFARNRGLYPK